MEAVQVAGAMIFCYFLLGYGFGYGFPEDDQLQQKTISSTADGSDLHTSVESGWSYGCQEDECGPSHWAELSPEWDLCKNGKQQSPINIATYEVLPDPDDSIFEAVCENTPDASEANFTNDGHNFFVKFLQSNPDPLLRLSLDFAQVFHAISSLMFFGHEQLKQPNPAQLLDSCLMFSFNLQMFRRGVTVAVDKINYTMVYLTFKAPSEHTIDGVQAAFEAQLLLKSESGAYAAHAWLFDYNPDGSDNPNLYRYLEYLPLLHEKGAMLINKPTHFELPGVDIFPTYRYWGSLTTPPCTEGVMWTMNTVVLTVSERQHKDLVAALHGFSNRPIQPSNGRPVYGTVYY